MKILAIDTAHGVCSVALSEDDRVICAHTDSESSKQAERLFQIIDKTLQECGLSYSDIDAIACDIGPGSFTGVRIGLAAARGIALAANIPIIGVSGLKALAHSAKMSNDFNALLVAFDARRGQVFAQFFDNSTNEELLLEYKDIINTLNNATNITLIGDGAGLIETQLHENSITYCINSDFLLPTASTIALCAFEEFKSGEYNFNPTPLYIRPPDAKLPGNKNKNPTH